MSAMHKCPPGYIPQWLNGKFLGCSRAYAGMGAAVGLGAVDWNDQTLIDVATALNDSLNANGCTQNKDPLVSAFQAAYIAAGGTIPQDSGGRSPIDGYYGNNTAAALTENFPDAVAGCVGAGYSGAPTGGTALGPTLRLSAATAGDMTLFSSMFDGSSSFFGLASGWWILGAVALAAVTVVVNPKPGRAAPRRLSKKARNKRSSRRGKKKSRRR
jgi:hypothetical protein